ncbi:MAG: phosphoribosylformylglycinamidine synthase subunit PurQ, partial [Verrucomicrobiales bacterium]|nr:phosphoribosylformylglycinamidine synthase subunit PurQ [Verrucomicrobiales bacterium]
ENAFLEMLPERFEFPIAHAEGRFVTEDEGGAEAYVRDGLAALTYSDDVNGSHARIAGMADETGRVFGLMPHPERFLYAKHHYDPDWRGVEGSERGAGYWFFKSIYNRITSAN